ncbi:MAG: XdhC family protein [Pseudomonadota bacterium]
MATKSYLEHPEDVLDQWLTWSSQGAACLAVVTATEGGAVRAAGALMAISELGDVAGYVSGGCIDADVRLHALDCIESGQAKALRYGAGSPFKDLPLPCGGAIEIALLPRFEIDEARRCLARLRERLPARLEVSSGRGLYPSPTSQNSDCGLQGEARMPSHWPKLRKAAASKHSSRFAMMRMWRWRRHVA